MMFLFQIQMNEYREFESSSSTSVVSGSVLIGRKLGGRSGAIPFT
jgi:hypothetical protein